MAYTNIVKKGAPVQKEDTSGEAINPGSLLDFNASGNLVEQSTDGATNIPKLFALENENFGEDLNVAYESGDEVTYVAPAQGDEVVARLAAGANVSKGDALEADGDISGALQAQDTGDVIAFAAESVDNSGTSSTAFIQVEVA